MTFLTYSSIEQKVAIGEKGKGTHKKDTLTIGH